MMAMMLIDTCVVINTIEVIVESVFVIDVGGGGLCRRFLIIMSFQGEFSDRFIIRILEVFVVIIEWIVVVGLLGRRDLIKIRRKSSKFAWGYNESVVNAFIGRDVVIVVVITVVVVGSGRNVVVVVIEGGSG